MNEFNIEQNYEYYLQIEREEKMSRIFILYNFICKICDKFEPNFHWCDVHGIASCMRCGTAYKILHYENNKLIEKQPELLLKPEFVEICKKYWNETNTIAPSGYCFVGSSYKLETPEQEKQFYEYLEKEKENVNVL